MILGKEFAITSTGESCNPLDACEQNKKMNKIEKSALLSGPLAVLPAKTGSKSTIIEVNIQELVESYQFPPLIAEAI